MKSEDVFDGPGLDPEILKELSDQEAKELTEKTKEEMFLRAHYYDEFFYTWAIFLNLKNKQHGRLLKSHGPRL